IFVNRLDGRYSTTDACTEGCDVCTTRGGASNTNEKITNFTKNCRRSCVLIHNRLAEWAFSEFNWPVNQWNAYSRRVIRASRRAGAHRNVSDSSEPRVNPVRWNHTPCFIQRYRNVILNSFELAALDQRQLLQVYPLEQLRRRLVLGVLAHQLPAH